MYAKSSKDDFLWFCSYFHILLASPDTLLFSSFFLFVRIIQGSCSYLYLFFLFFLLYVAVDTKPCWRRHQKMFIKESNGKYLFCHKSRLRWYSSNKFRPSLLCVSCFASHGFRFFDWLWVEIIWIVEII